jgi:hypothetical protein
MRSKLMVLLQVGSVKTDSEPFILINGTWILKQNGFAARGRYDSGKSL